MRFTKTLIGAAMVGAAAFSLLGPASPATAAAGPLTAFAYGSSIAPGTTGSVNFAFKNTGTTRILLESADPGSKANPSTIVFRAPSNASFPAQATVSTVISMDGAGAGWGNNVFDVNNCAVSDAGKTLSCAITGTNAGWPAGALRQFSPKMTVDSSASPGSVVTPSASINLYNSLAPDAGYVSASATAASLTSPPAIGAIDYALDSSVSIPGRATPGTTVTATDATGKVIGTAVVAADGTYTIKISAGNAAVAAAAGDVSISRSDRPGESTKLTVEVTKLGTPIINPLVGGVVLAAAAAVAGTVIVRRRKGALAV